MILLLTMSLLVMKILELANNGKSDRISRLVARHKEFRLYLLEALSQAATITLRKLRRVP